MCIMPTKPLLFTFVVNLICSMGEYIYMAATHMTTVSAKLLCDK